jgi:hypothetical protein
MMIRARDLVLPVTATAVLAAVYYVTGYTGVLGAAGFTGFLSLFVGAMWSGDHFRL